MQETDEEIITLLYKSISDQELEKKEETKLAEWLATSPNNQLILAELMDKPRLEKDVKALMLIDEDKALKTLHEKMRTPAGRRRRAALFACYRRTKWAKFKRVLRAAWKAFWDVSGAGFHQGD